MGHDPYKIMALELELKLMLLVETVRGCTTVRARRDLQPRGYSSRPTPGNQPPECRDLGGKADRKVLHEQIQYQMTQKPMLRCEGEGAPVRAANKPRSQEKKGGVCVVSHCL